MRNTEVDFLNNLDVDNAAVEVFTVHGVAVTLIAYDPVPIGRCKSLDWTDALERHITCACGVQNL